MSVGRRIREARLNAGLSQATLSTRSGIGASHLSRLETGQVVPTCETLRRIATSLNQSEDFFGEQPKEPSDRCPMALDHKCILSHPLVTIRPLPDVDESYTPAMLKTLRTANVLMHKGSSEIQSTLTHTVEALMALHISHGGRPL